jgi:thymus-specific serine protease
MMRRLFPCLVVIALGTQVLQQLLHPPSVMNYCCSFFLLFFVVTATTSEAAAAASSRVHGQQQFHEQQRLIDRVRYHRQRTRRRNKEQGAVTDREQHRSHPPVSATTTTTDSNIDNKSGKDKDKDDDVQELVFDQILDHFRISSSSSSSSPPARQQQQQQQQKKQQHEQQQQQPGNGTRQDRTFPQRYFYSNRFVDNSTNNRSEIDSSNGCGAPTNRMVRSVEVAFVCVGGEGPPLDSSVLVDSVHCTGDMLSTAERLYHQSHVQAHDERNKNCTTPAILLNIHLFALEHRFYGESFPAVNEEDGEEGSENLLVYLSSRQAAADLAHFLARQRALHRLDAIVLFGGSYPGMLAAFARIHYPHIVSAAVSNSAPVQAVVDFANYNNHVSANLGAIDPRCLEVVQTGHSELARQIQSNNSTKNAHIATRFHLCHPDAALAVRENVQLFLGDGVLYLGTQENDPACTDSPYCNIESKCRALVREYESERSTHATIDDATAAVNTLWWMVNELRRYRIEEDEDDNDDDCTDVDFQGMLDYIADPSNVEIRSWLWQTCTEFGFYQTCEVHSNCPYARGYHPLSQDLTICDRAFAVAPEAVFRAVQATNEWTGGWDLDASSNILSVTGTVDPWSELAVLRTRNHRSVPVHSVPGASHHFWTHPVRETDSPAVQHARDVIFQTVREWLAVPASSASGGDSNGVAVLKERDDALSPLRMQ